MYMFNFCDRHGVINDNIYILKFYPIILLRKRSLWLKTILKMYMEYLCYDIQQILFLQQNKSTEAPKKERSSNYYSCKECNFCRLHLIYSG